MLRAGSGEQHAQSLFGHGESEWYKLMLFVHDMLWPYFVGGLLPGLVAAIASYYVARPLVAAYQVRRRARMLARAHERLARQSGATAYKRGRVAKPGSEGP